MAVAGAVVPEVAVIDVDVDVDVDRDGLSRH